MKVFQDGITKLWDKLEGWGETLIANTPNILIAILILVAFWLLSKKVSTLTKKSFNASHVNKNLSGLLSTTAGIAFFCLGIVFALSVLELQKTVFSLLAGVGVLGLALGFAFQDLAANFMAGIMLAIRSPFKPEDVIEINDITATVVNIRLRDTLVRDFDGHDIYIPNKEFMSNSFSNFSSFGKRKTTIAVGVGYEDDHDKAVNLLQKTVEELDFALSDPKPSVFIDELAGSSVNLKVRVWFEYPGENILEINSKLLSKVKSTLTENGFNIPFPIRTLDLPEEFLTAMTGKSESSQSSSHKGDNQNLEDIVTQ